MKVGFRRRSEPATLPRRPNASNSCSTGHSAHSRLLGVIIPQAQEFAISGNVYRGLVGVLIRGPCLEQSASLQLCVWAVLWYRQAANQGDADAAQFCLEVEAAIAAAEAEAAENK